MIGARRGAVFIEIVVVLGLFAILSVYVMTAAMGVHHNGRRIEDFALRQSEAQLIADRVARRISLALAPSPNMPFRLELAEQGPQLLFAVAHERVRGATYDMKLSNSGKVWSGGMRKLIRLTTVDFSTREGNIVDGHLRWLAELDRPYWEYRLDMVAIGDAARPDVVSAEWREPRLPDAVQVRVEVTNSAKRFAGAPPALGVAVARLRNAGLAVAREGRP